MESLLFSSILTYFQGFRTKSSYLRSRLPTISMNSSVCGQNRITPGLRIKVVWVRIKGRFDLQFLWKQLQLPAVPINSDGSGQIGAWDVLAIAVLKRWFKHRYCECCVSRVSFKKHVFATKPFSLLRDHFWDVSFVPLNHKNSGLRPSDSL